MSQESFSPSVSSHGQVPILPSCPFVPADGISKNYPQLWAIPPIQSFQSFFFFFLTAPRGICLVPPPGIKSAPPALEAQSLNDWTIGEVPSVFFFHFIVLSSLL